VDIADKFVFMYIGQKLKFVHRNKIFLNVVLRFTVSVSFDTTHRRHYCEQCFFSPLPKDGFICWNN